MPYVAISLLAERFCRDTAAPARPHARIGVACLPALFSRHGMARAGDGQTCVRFGDQTRVPVQRNDKEKHP